MAYELNDIKEVVKILRNVAQNYNEEDIATAIKYYLDKAGSADSSGTVISFDQQRTYGKTVAENGNITVSHVGAVSGVVQLVRHNAGTEPTFPSECKKLSSYSYTTGVVNYIYLEYVSATEILVTASVAA